MSWLTISIELTIKITSWLTIIVVTERALSLFLYAYSLLKRWPERHKPRLDVHHKEPSILPNVLVQLPMMNEGEVCRSTIDACCCINWPRDKIHIQVLDDSDDSSTLSAIDAAVEEWQGRGHSITVIRRENKQGYKAGNLRNGLSLVDKLEYPYIAIFDADFHPPTDFLHRCIPYLENCRDVGFVQTSWSFRNRNQNILTKSQELWMSYHFLCDEYSRYVSGSFVTFCGSAAVIRRSTLESLGGWNEKQPNEDFNFSVKVFLSGGKAVFLEDVQCSSQLPCDLSNYRSQQHRWHSITYFLFQKQLYNQIRRAQNISTARKLELYVRVFIIVKTLRDFFVTDFVSICILAPLCIVCRIEMPVWLVLYAPLIMAQSTALLTPQGGWKLAIVYLLFENCLGVVRLNATLAGILGSSSVLQWLVTGDVVHHKNNVKYFFPELVFALVLIGTSVYGILTGETSLVVCVVVLLQGVAFGLWGTDNLNVLNGIFLPLKSE